MCKDTPLKPATPVLLLQIYVTQVIRELYPYMDEREKDVGDVRLSEKSLLHPVLHDPIWADR